MIMGQLFENDHCDEIAGNHKENVDADKPPFQHFDPPPHKFCMINNDGNHSDCTQAINFWTIFQ